MGLVIVVQVHGNVRDCGELQSGNWRHVTIAEQHVVVLAVPDRIMLEVSRWRPASQQ